MYVLTPERISQGHVQTEGGLLVSGPFCITYIGQMRRKVTLVLYNECSVTIPQFKQTRKVFYKARQENIPKWTISTLSVNFIHLKQRRIIRRTKE